MSLESQRDYHLVDGEVGYYAWAGDKIGRGNNTLIQANTVGESTNSFFVYQQV